MAVVTSTLPWSICSTKRKLQTIRCVEPGALQEQKRKYKDSYTDLVFINGCRQAFGRVAGWQVSHGSLLFLELSIRLCSNLILNCSFLLVSHLGAGRRGTRVWWKFRMHWPGTEMLPNNKLQCCRWPIPRAKRSRSNLGFHFPTGGNETADSRQVGDAIETFKLVFIMRISCRSSKWNKKRRKSDSVHR